MNDKSKNFFPDFLIIPYQLFLDESINSLDRNVYGVIYWFHKLKEGRCFASNEVIAKVAGSKSPISISNSLARLEKSSFIRRIFDDSNNRQQIIPLVSYGGGSSVDEGGFTHRLKGGSSVDEHISNTDKEYRENENSKEFSPSSQELEEPNTRIYVDSKESGDVRSNKKVKREKKDFDDFTLEADEDTIPTRSFQKQTKGRKQVEEKENTTKFIDVFFPKICEHYGVPPPYVTKTDRMEVQKNISRLLKAGFDMVKIGNAAKLFVEEQSINKSPLSIHPKTATSGYAMNRLLQNQ